MFMNKSGTPKRNKKRPSVKVSSLNAGYIQQWIGKDESISKFVNDAIEAKHREKEREKKTSDYNRMKESGAYYKVEQLKEQMDKLIVRADEVQIRLAHTEEKSDLLEQLVSLFKWSYVSPVTKLGKTKPADKKIWHDIYNMSKKLQKHSKK